MQQAFTTANNLDLDINTYDPDMLACLLQDFEDTIDDTFAHVNTMTVFGNTSEESYCPIATTPGPSPQTNFIMDKETIASLQAPKEIEILPIQANQIPYTYHHNNFNINSKDQGTNDSDQAAFIRVLISNDESQSHTGASRHLANSEALIWKFQPCEPFLIGNN